MGSSEVGGQHSISGMAREGERRIGSVWGGGGGTGDLTDLDALMERNREKLGRLRRAMAEGAGRESKTVVLCLH